MILKKKSSTWIRTERESKKDQKNLS